MKKFNESRPTITEEEKNGLKAIMEAQKARSEKFKAEKEEERKGLEAIRIAQLKRQGRL
jgi:hypothetical protein